MSEDFYGSEMPSCYVRQTGRLWGSVKYMSLECLRCTEEASEFQKLWIVEDVT